MKEKIRKGIAVQQILVIIFVSLFGLFSTFKTESIASYTYREKDGYTCLTDLKCREGFSEGGHNIAPMAVYAETDAYYAGVISIDPYNSTRLYVDPGAIIYFSEKITGSDFWEIKTNGKLQKLNYSTGNNTITFTYDMPSNLRIRLLMT